MLKKFITTLILISIASPSVLAVPQQNGFSKKFTQKFKNCDVYAEPYTFNMYGTVFHDYKQIQGWNGNFCGYKQITGTSDGQLTVTCSFNKNTLDTLYKALLLKPDKYGKDNPTETIWNKYIHNPNMCKFTHSGVSTEGIRVDERYLPNFK